MPSSDTVGGDALPSLGIPVSLNETGWNKLAWEIDEGASDFYDCEDTAKGLMWYLREVLGVQSYLLEEHYIDRDYSADYQYFYARVFRDYDRYCKRIHFFSEDISQPFRGKQPSVSDILDKLRQVKEEASYCGFCVLRPLPHAKIGRTVLKGKIVVPGGGSCPAAVTCRANFRVNLFGIDLEVTGSAFLQQDARVGACAQVALWVGMRHMHARHDYNWASVADITKHAEPITTSEAGSLPAGSSLLSDDAMIRAIHRAGYQPLHFHKHDAKPYLESIIAQMVRRQFSRLSKLGVQKDETDGSTGRKANDKVVNNIGDKIFPYVESGIPVILGWDYKHGRRKVTSHAVTVVGRVLVERNDPDKLARSKSAGGYIYAHNYVVAYVVHDDQAGPYMLLPTNHDDLCRLKQPEKLEKSEELGMLEKSGELEMSEKLKVLDRLGKSYCNALVKREKKHKSKDGNIITELINLNVREHAHTAMVLMSTRVFFTASVAERAAWDIIRNSLRNISDKAQDDCNRLKFLPEAFQELVEKPEKGMLSETSDKIVLRTYLSSVAGYRRHLADSSANDKLKHTMLAFHLPHFVWVTEISTTDSYNRSISCNSPSDKCCVYGHAVIDATSAHRSKSLLALHLPGVLVTGDIEGHFDGTQEIAEEPQPNPEELQAIAEELREITEDLQKITTEPQGNVTYMRKSATELRAIAEELQEITKESEELSIIIIGDKDKPYECREKKLETSVKVLNNARQSEPMSQDR